MQLTRKMFLALALAGALFVHADGLTFKIAADKADCLYRCGERTTFTVTAVGADGQPAAAGP